MTSVIQSGFGFVVGESDGTIYVVTTDHLVRGDQLEQKPSRIAVSFFEDQGKKYQAEFKHCGPNSRRRYRGDRFAATFRLLLET